MTGRWLDALLNPTYLDAKATRVQNAVVEVRRVSEELLNRTVTEVKRLNLGKLISLLCPGAFNGI